MPRLRVWRSVSLTGLTMLLAAFLLLPLQTPSVSAGTLGYAKSFGGQFTDEGFGIAVSSTGAILVAGRFFDTVDFDPGPANSSAAATGATADGFVSRFNAGGDFINPVLVFNGNGEDRADAVAFDASGNIYVTGTYAPVSQADVFITKRDPDGGFLWAAVIGAAFNDAGKALAVDGAGNVYVTGIFTGTVDFDPGPGVVNLVSSGGTPDVFVLKLDTNGNLVWATSFPGNDLDTGTGIAVDANQNVYVIGNFRGNIGLDQGGGQLVYSSLAGDDVFVVKLNSSGTTVWGTAFRGLQADSAAGLAVDSAGNVYATGNFSGTVDFNLLVPQNPVNLSSSGQEDMFLVKLNANGAAVWAKRFGATGFDSGTGVAVDAGGNAYVTGTFNGTATFTPSTTPLSLTSNGGFDMFVIKVDTNGNPVWAHQFGGSFFDIANAVAVDGSGNVYVTGDYSGSNVDFDPGAGTTNLSSNGGGDVFLLKLAQVAPPVNTVPGAQSAVSDTQLVFSTAGGNRISIADADNGSSPLRVTLTVNSGTLTLPSTTGLTFTAGDGTADATMTFGGTLTAINAALDGLRFTPVLNGATSATLQVSTRDVNAVSGGQTDSDSVAITIKHRPVAVNDSYSLTYGTGPLSVAAVNGLLANDSDADTNKALLTVAVTGQPAKGTVNVSADGAFTYTPNSNASGPDVFSYRVTDPDGLSATATATITVNTIACGPRPSVVTATSVASGALQVTVAVSDANGPTQNRLQSISFGTLQNATVTLNGQPISNGQVVQAPANSTSISFAVQRATPGQTTTVPFTVTDSCGTWQSFVGGGTGAGF